MSVQKFLKEILYEGKAKIVYQSNDEDTYVIKYKDTATALNGVKKENIAGKGEINCRISNIIYEMLSLNHIPTHFIRELDPISILVKKLEIIPLEVIIRNTATGSFSKRFGTDEGTPLEPAVLEFCYKNDSLGDPMINNSQILALHIASEKEIATISELAYQINQLLIAFFEKANLRLIDFKIEFGRCKGEIILADEISPDTCRLWDMSTNEKLDKDLFRLDLGDILRAYQEVLRRVSL